MAWITVHDQVLGIKLSKLANRIQCSQNEALGLLVRLWIFGINNADRYGYLCGLSKDDLVEILSIGMDKRINKEAAINCLVECKFIDLCGGEAYIHDWVHWQELWYKGLDRKKKDAERKKKSRAKTNIKEVKMNIEEIPKKKTYEYPEGFEEFWKVYPRKIEKGNAFKKYKARINDGWSPEELIGAAYEYSKQVSQKHTEMQYIKHPKTFLADSTPFADYIPKRKNDYINEDDPYADWR